MSTLRASGLAVRTAAVLASGAVLALAWPGPTSAATDLGGYSGLAQAYAAHVQVYDPVIPLPVEPQGDVSIGFTKASTETGPTSRALASYLWPGDVIGDGFEAVSGQPGSTYPVQVNSRYPATSGAPATNAAQLTGDNGMTTRSNESVTTATVTGAGITAATGSGTLQGSCQLVPAPGCTPVPPTDAPVPVMPTVATAVSMTSVSSTSSVTLAARTVTASATTHASGIRVLGGLVTIGSVDVSTVSVSDGAKASSTGATEIAGLVVAGTAVAAPTEADPVEVPELGLRVELTPAGIVPQGFGSSRTARGLVVTVDTAPLRAALQLGTVTSQLGRLLEMVPGVGQQLSALLNLGPKIVILLGDVSSSATAATAYVAPPPQEPTGGTTTGGTTDGTTGSPLLPGAPSLPETQSPPLTPPQVSDLDPLPVPAAAELPDLGSVPRRLLAAALLFAAALGWVLHGLGAFLLGSDDRCSFGLTSGLPDLRRGLL